MIISRQYDFFFPNSRDNKSIYQDTKLIYRDNKSNIEIISRNIKITKLAISNYIFDGVTIIRFRN